MSFTTFQNEKTRFKAIKTRSLKSRKIAIIPKGLTHGFGPKNGHFSNFFFLGKLGQENVIYDILEQKTAFQAIKTRSSKSRKIGFFLQGLTHRFWTIMAFVATSFFLSKIGQENVFYDILKRKNPFLGYQKRRSKSRKIGIIRKRLTHGFGPKMAIFPTSFFQVKEIRKMSLTIFENEKTLFQVIKTRS